MSIAALFGAFALGVQADDSISRNLDCFVFLVTGKPTAGTPKEEIQQMQAAHLQNFERLAKTKELSAAGPCADPEKTIRGIVVLHAPTLEKAESLFETDPYIHNGYMKPEIHPYRTLVGKFVVPENEQALDKYTLVIVSTSKEYPLAADQQEQIITDLEKFAKKQFADGSLGFAGLFEKTANVPSQRLAVMVFRNSDIEQVKKLLQERNIAAGEKLKLQVFQQYMVKNAMPSATP